MNLVFPCIFLFIFIEYIRKQALCYASRIKKAMFKHKSFNPNVIIEDHFGDVKNQIDIRAEIILHGKSHILSENRQQFLNKLRQMFLDRIDQVKEKNLSTFTSYNDEESLNFKCKFCSIWLAN
jgi:exonuclease III